MNAWIIPGLKNNCRKGSADWIIEQVCEVLCVSSLKVINDAKGTKSISYARDWCIWFIIKHHKMYSLGEIGSMFSNRHYSTIICARNRVIERLYNKEYVLNRKYVRDYKKIREIINPYLDVHINQVA